MRILFYLIIVLLPLLTSAQLQHNHWFLGFNAAVDFSTNPPSNLTGALSTDEGVSSIADSTGQLLFFSNGEQVWDRNQNVMPNGTGLKGHFSSSQSALIVPYPGDPTLFYLFTTPAEAGTWTGVGEMHFNVIDMSLNNGLGDVLTKNVQLVGPITEKISATRHANGEDVWVVVHGWNNTEYHAYLLTCTGLEGPVTSSIGRHMGPDQFGGTNGALGCMKLNPQGTKLAATWTNATPPNPQGWASSVYVDVLDFDNATGQLSNVLNDSIGGGVGSSNANQAYGVEFSPNGQLVYVSDNGLSGGIFTSSIHQYDLTGIDPMNNEITIASGIPAHGSIQRGPDGSIYIARLNGATYLSSISDPDVVGTGCNHVANGLSLGANPSTWGLPNHWDTYPTPPPIDPILWSDSLVCSALNGIVVDATISHPFHTYSYLWSTGETSSSITVNASGIYTVEVFAPCSTYFDTVQVTIGGLLLDLGPDQWICEGAELVLSIDDPGNSVLWSTGDTTLSLLVQEEGVYSVQVIDSMSCMSSDTVLITTRNCDCPVYVPNAYTPNGDGINDGFTVRADCAFADYELNVFSRWGELLFTSSDPSVPWLGKDMPMGVYAYTLNWTWHDGSALQRKHKAGHVTVLK